MLLAVVALVRDRTAAPATGGHEHGGAERHAPWLLLAPVLVIALVAPPALGADAVARSGPHAVVQASDVFAPLPPGDAPEVALAEFVQRAVWTHPVRSTVGRSRSPASPCGAAPPPTSPA
ncbi:hypothetical protein [Pseudonocardia nigra]|uniref:hypothetical protein n=1 Tax=Pseudonocardia nigra TaxID=1921578 RepID=UPI001C607A0B|nr:hypothetical protein [Pseudonocardia nigra]